MSVLFWSFDKSVYPYMVRTCQVINVTCNIFFFHKIFGAHLVRSKKLQKKKGRKETQTVILLVSLYVVCKLAFMLDGIIHFLKFCNAFSTVNTIYLVLVDLVIRHHTEGIVHRKRITAEILEWVIIYVTYVDKHIQCYQ